MIVKDERSRKYPAQIKLIDVVIGTVFTGRIKNDVGTWIKFPIGAVKLDGGSSWATGGAGCWATTNNECANRVVEDFEPRDCELILKA